MSTFAEPCLSSGIGLLLTYLETLWTMERSSLSFSSLLSCQKVMEIIDTDSSCLNNLVS